MTRPLGPAGKLMTDAAKALRSGDREAFEDATLRLGRLLVAGGMDASERPLLERVATTTSGLRQTLVASVLNQGDPRAKSAVEAVALACSNLDARIAVYGMPPDPLSTPPDPEPGAPKRRRKA